MVCDMTEPRLRSLPNPRDMSTVSEMFGVVDGAGTGGVCCGCWYDAFEDALHRGLVLAH